MAKSVKLSAEKRRLIWGRRWLQRRRRTALVFTSLVLES